MKRGFTLVEMLIALTIFGMLTAAGVALLTLTVRTQATLEQVLDKVGELRRMGALMSADFGQAARRTSRDRDGRPRPAFIGADANNELLISLIRGGGGEEELPRRVEYRLRAGRLDRLSYARVDGEARPVTVPLLTGLRGLALRYRNRDGEWLAVWAATDPAELPRAVEITTDDPAHGSVRQLFAVGSGR